MNFRRLVSAVAALAVAGTCVVTSGVSALAATTVVSEDFSDTTFEDITVGLPSSGYAVVDYSNGYMNVTPNSTSGDRTANINFNTVATVSDVTEISFKATFGGGDTNKNGYIYVLPTSSGTTRYPSTTNALLTIIDSGSTNLKVNNTDLGTTYADKELTYDVIFDRTYSTVTTKIYSGTTLIATDVMTNVDSSITTIGSLSVQVRRSTSSSSAYINVDDLLVQNLTRPAMTLSASSVNPTVGGSETITATNVTGTITAVSSDESIATVAVDDDNNIIITGVKEDVTTVVVTATNDGLTVTQTIDVTVGDVESKTVTINYYITGTENAVPVPDGTPTSLNAAVGSSIDLDDVYTTTIEKEDAKYVYNSTDSTSLPYTVIDGDNVINIYYDEYAAVTTATINYMYNGTEVYSRDVSASGYEGDEITVVDVFYVNGTDGVIYKTGDDLYTTNTEETNTSATTAYDRTITLGTDLEVDVTVADNAVFFVEGEDLGLDSTTNDRTTYLTCSGNAASGAGTKTSSVDIYTAAEGAKYQIVVVSFARSRNSVLKIGDETIATVGNYNNNYRGRYQVVEFEMSKDDVLTYTSDGTNALTEIDYILIRKTGELDPVITADIATGTTVDTATVPTIANTDSVYASTDTAKTNAIEYSTLKGTEDVTTIYVKIDNVADDTIKPTLVVNKEAISPVWEPVSGTNIYFAQFIGDPTEDFGGTITVQYSGADDYELSLVTESE